MNKYERVTRTNQSNYQNYIQNRYIIGRFLDLDLVFCFWIHSIYDLNINIVNTVYQNENKKLIFEPKLYIVEKDQSTLSDDERSISRNVA